MWGGVLGLAIAVETGKSSVDVFKLHEPIPLSDNHR